MHLHLVQVFLMIYPILPFLVILCAPCVTPRPLYRLLELKNSFCKVLSIPVNHAGEQVSTFHSFHAFFRWNSHFRHFWTFCALYVWPRGPYHLEQKMCGKYWKKPKKWAQSHLCSSIRSKVIPHTRNFFPKIEVEIGHPLPTLGEANSHHFWSYLDQFCHNLCFKIYVT